MDEQDTTPAFRFTVMFQSAGSPHAVPGQPYRVADGRIDSGNPYVCACELESQANMIAASLNQTVP